MGKPLGELHYALQTEVAWLHLKWADFRALFATSKETIDLLNQAAPTFFGNLQSMMWEDALLHLCRLTDPPKSARKDTLTIRRLPLLVPDPDLQSNVERLADDARKAAEFARDWRNRRLAHKELPPLDGGAPEPLAVASLEHVEMALAAIRETMNCVEQHYLKRLNAYQHSIEGLGGVASLLKRLRVSLGST
jgi:hypothetical protein